MNKNARYITAEVLLNEQEKRSAVAVCKDLGIGLSTWYRGLGNAAIRTHGMPPAPPKESRGCRGSRPANRASVGMQGGQMRPRRV